MSAREVIERTFAAPLTLVWELWTTPAGVAAWFGPPGFTTTVQRLELRPGGAFDYTMAADAAASSRLAGRPTSWPAHAVVTEVVPRSRLVYSLEMPMGPGRVVSVIHTVTFEETPAGVRVVLTLEADGAEVIGGAAMGYRASFDRLAAHLTGG
jgi:uncharacterized protein YndB with AHSA1/START domain